MGAPADTGNDDRPAKAVKPQVRNGTPIGTVENADERTLWERIKSFFVAAPHPGGAGIIRMSDTSPWMKGSSLPYGTVNWLVSARSFSGSLPKTF